MVSLIESVRAIMASSAQRSVASIVDIYHIVEILKSGIDSKVSSSATIARDWKFAR